MSLKSKPTTFFQALMSNSGEVEASSVRGTSSVCQKYGSFPSCGVEFGYGFLQWLMNVFFARPTRVLHALLVVVAHER